MKSYHLYSYTFKGLSPVLVPPPPPLVQLEFEPGDEALSAVGDLESDEVTVTNGGDAELEVVEVTRGLVAELASS